MLYFCGKKPTIQRLIQMCCLATELQALCVHLTVFNWEMLCNTVLWRSYRHFRSKSDIYSRNTRLSAKFWLLSSIRIFGSYILTYFRSRRYFRLVFKFSTYINTFLTAIKVSDPALTFPTRTHIYDWNWHNRSTFWKSRGYVKWQKPIDFPLSKIGHK